MTNSLAGKVAIVTGGGRGLGRAFAHALGQEGARVVVASRNSDDLARTVAEADAAGFEAFARPTDVTDEQSVDGLVADAVAQFGGLDILVNNSGVVLTRSLVDITLAEWDSVLDTNLRGMFLATRAAGRQLISQGRGGKVINIASNFGLMGVQNHVAYSSSKAGVIGFTRSAAIEWARHGIQVNAIAPGYFATDMNAVVDAPDSVKERVLKSIPARRMGEADELRPWVIALAGPASDFMTGEVIVVDGGQAAA